MLEPRPLGQLLLMQSIVTGLPDENSIFSFVCRGLLDMPGVTGVRYANTPQEDTAASTVRMPLLLGETYRGELLFMVADGEAFAPYADYLKNFCYMLAVILEERSQRRQNELLCSELEARVGERTSQLQQQIAERESIEQSLRESEGRFRALVENLPVRVFIKDRESVYVICNPSYAADIGAGPEDIRGKTDYDFYPTELAEKYRADDRRIMESGRGEEIEEAYIGGGRQQWVHTIKIPLMDESHDVTGILGALWDISGRKRAEEEKARLEAQLQQAQKMELVDRLAGGVAHDFNNMLAVILGHAEIALGRVDPTQPLYDNLDEILKAAARSADLTRQLLTFARKQTVAPKVLDLNETIAGMFKMIERLIGEDISLVWKPQANLWPTKVDPSQLDQILANLCVNARDAITGVGRITIETTNSSFDEAYCSRHLGFVPGDYVRLAVSDDGCGMDKETMAHIFEPFFTTKGVGKGTGLGLATVYGAVRQNNGFINVYSEPGQGTTFAIYLPRQAGKDEHMRSRGPVEPVPRGKETILLVEDEPTILKTATMLLVGQGYTVVAAGTPGDAIRIAREHTGEIHLLMTDVVMPEMNGRDLAKNLLMLYPRLKRLFMSGYTANVIAHHGVLDEGVCFIQKPFSIRELSAKVREALDRG